MSVPVLISEPFSDSSVRRSLFPWVQDRPWSDRYLRRGVLFLRLQFFEFEFSHCRGTTGTSEGVPWTCVGFRNVLKFKPSYRHRLKDLNV